MIRIYTKEETGNSITNHIGEDGKAVLPKGINMIELTKLNGEKFYLNPNHIEIIEMKPDTLITLVNGRKHYANESVDVIIERIISFNAAVGAQAGNIILPNTSVVDVD